MHRTFFILLGTLALAIPGRSLAADESLPLAVVAEGESFRAALAGADASWKLCFEGAAGEREIKAEDLVLWGSLAEPGAGALIVLPGGDIVVADVAQIANERLRGKSQSFGELDLPLELVAAIVLRPPSDRATLDAWLARVGAPGGPTDRVLLDNGDELTGTVAGLDDKGVSLDTDAGKVEVELNKTAAVFFNPTLVYKARPTGLRSLVGFRDGSRLTAIELAADRKSAQLKLPGGAELTAPSESIVALQPWGGRVTYLSDLKAAAYRHVPFLQLSWPFHADRSVLGSQLRAGGKIYAKGLGMHSPARLTYDLDGSHRRFESELAIDAESGARGSVEFRVFTDDGRGGWQLRASSKVVRGGQPPESIAVDVTGAKRLSLLVDYADRGDELDHADWLNARLVR